MVIRIELSKPLLIALFSNFLRNLTIPCRIFLYLVTCFPTVAVSILCWSQGRTISSPFTNYIDRDKLEDISIIRLVTGIATKPWLSGNMFPNIKTCENGWSNFSEKLRIMALKFLELTRFLSLNLSIYSYLLNFVRFSGPLLSNAIFSAQSIYK